MLGIFKDIWLVAHKWRLVHLIGISALRARYARSMFGQLWLSLTTLAQIVCIGLFWAVIWRQPIDEFLPYYGVGMILFNLTAQTIGESAGVFVGDARYYMNDKIPFMLSIFSLIYRNILIFLHNVPIIVLLILWSESARFAPDVNIIPAVLLTTVFTVTVSYLVASICTRYRDLAQIVGIVISNLFLLTPLMWRPEFIPEEYREYIFYNPLAAMVECLRNPLLGVPVEAEAYISLTGWTVIALMLGMLLHRRFEHRLVYWV